MGVYIHSMEKPTSCISCLLNFGEKRPEYGLTIYCPYSDGVISWRDKAFDNGRLASCGIVPVPKHGRLIDADAYKQELKDCRMAFWDELLDSMPTIIEAEEGE